MTDSPTIAYTSTALPPCSLRYHPQIPNLLFAGTYKLNEADKTRHGSIEVYQLQDDSQLKLLFNIPTKSAILDMKFSPFDDSLILSGHSTGEVSLWRFKGLDEGLELIHTEQIFEEDNLITSVIFSQIHEGRVLITSTEGSAVVVQISKDGKLEDYLELSSRHDLQCWTGVFGNLNELDNVIFTGGDDGALIAHDFRTQSEIFKAGRIHNAGVVALQTATPGDHNGKGDWFVNSPYKFLTGCYDDCIRELDLRCIPETGLIPGMPPRVIQEQNLGGGVWRMQPSPEKGDNRLLVCCMYDGARIFNSESFEVEKYYKEKHESMVYGADWNPNDVNQVATVSFYDNVLQVWKP